MTNRKPTSEEVLDAISKLSNEAEWSQEELREAIMSDGGDPDRLQQYALPRIKYFLKKRADKAAAERLLQRLRKDPVTSKRGSIQRKPELIQQITASLDSLDEDQLHAILDLIHIHQER